MPTAATLGKEDPYYDYLDLPGKKKPRRTKKRIPDGLSQNDAKILKHFRSKAHALDLSFECCCGCKVGWAGIIGLIPWVGDIIAASLSLSLITLARKIDGGLPAELYSKMAANVTFDFVIGLIPLVGDLINIAYKANSRNCLLLEKHLIRKAAHNNTGVVETTTYEPQVETTTYIEGGQDLPSYQTHEQPPKQPPRNTNNRQKNSLEIPYTSKV